MRPLFLLTLLLLPLPAPAALPQTAMSEAAIRDAIESGDAARADLRPRDALETFRTVLAGHPDRYEALWRAAREAVSLGMLAEDGGGAWYEEATRYARRAVEVDPDGVAGHEWLAVALGQNALDEGARTRVRLAEEIRTVALRTLELDPSNAVAHHVLGEWHAEIKRLSGVARWMAEKLLGADAFGDASWEAARENLERAVELSPANLVHHLALGRLYLDLDRPQEARARLQDVLDRPVRTPTDPLHKRHARRLLDDL
jgi:tetratricopeptide (TPR) repeat protein